MVCTVALSAVMRLKAGDHVPHVFDYPTTGTFDFKGNCRSFRQQPPAVAAPNLFFNPSHSLKVLSCAPEHRLLDKPLPPKLRAGLIAAAVLIAVSALLTRTTDCISMAR